MCHNADLDQQIELFVISVNPIRGDDTAAELQNHWDRLFEP